MALIKDTVIDQIEILEDGSMQIRRAVYAVEDGVRIGCLGYHRVTYAPGANVTAEDTKVQAHAAVAWTPDVIAAYLAYVAAHRRVTTI